MGTSELSVINTDLITAVATGFLARAETVRVAVSKVMRDHPFAASAAIVAAKMVLSESMTETDKGFFLACIKTGDLLIEGGKQPTDEAVFRAIVDGTAKGLKFGCTQYSVWTTGKLYIKEEGYRQLFANRKDCSHLDVCPELPEWRQLKDKSMWAIKGRASVAVNGEIVDVEGTVGISGNSTDMISNITAKADRAFLVRLWKKVSSIEVEEDDGSDTFDDAKPATDGTDTPRIDTKQPPAPLPFTTQIEQATLPRHLDVIARAIVAAKLSTEETEYLKAMVTEARKRLETAA